MNQTKRRSKKGIIIVCSVLMMVLAGCGSNKGDTNTGATGGIIVEKNTEMNTKKNAERYSDTEKEGEMIGEADLIIPETREELEAYNKNTIDFVLREVREHMKNSSLRNLVEERSATSPQYASALRILDKNYSEYLLEYTQVY